MKKTITGPLAAAGFLLGMVGLTLGLLPTPARAQTTAARPVEASGLVVQGVGEVMVKPDIARLALGVRTEAATSAVAVRENAQRADAIIKAVRAAGVAEADIQTTGFNMYPKVVYDPPKELGGGMGVARTAGYYVENTIRVTVRKVTEAGTVLDAATKAGANAAGGIAFDLNDTARERAEEEALTRAVAAAERKARVLARAVKAGRITLRSVVEGGAEPVQPLFQGGMAAMRAEAAPPTPIQPGELVIRASVTLNYNLNFALRPEMLK